MAELYYKKDNQYVKLTASDLGVDMDNYLPLSGGKLDGGLRIDDNFISIHSTGNNETGGIHLVSDTYDMSVNQTATAPSITFWDKNEKQIGYIITRQFNDKYMYLDAGAVCEFDGVKYGNNFALTIGNYGSVTQNYIISDKAKFRSALNLGDTTGPVPIECGGTNATTKMDAADSLAVVSLKACTEIPANSDLNNYKAIGNYAVSYSNVATTMKNCPTKEAFKMIVSTPISNTDGADVNRQYWLQTIIPFTGTAIYMRSFDGWGGELWNPWRVFNSVLVS